MPSNHIYAMRFLPTGMNEDDVNAPSFNLFVLRKTNGLYALVSHIGRDCASYDFDKKEWVWLERNLSGTTLREACNKAEEEIDKRKVNGKTWAEWQESSIEEGK